MIYISLRFDDGHLSQYNFGYKLLNKYNMVATFFLTTNKIGQKEAWPCKLVPYINYSQLHEMIKNGNEIGSHSKTHKKSWEKGKEEDIKYEICESLYDFRKNNIFPKLFCFPYTSTSESSIDLCNKYYDAYLAGYSVNRIKKGDIKNNFIQSIPTRFGVDKIINVINKKQDNECDEWLVITIHEIIDSPSVVGITKNDFVKIVNTIYNCINNGTHKILTISDAYKIFKS